MQVYEAHWCYDKYVFMYTYWLILHVATLILGLVSGMRWNTFLDGLFLILFQVQLGVDR